MSEKLKSLRQRREERSRRIKAELRTFGTLRQLHRRVAGQLGDDARGTSYGAIRAIVEGEVDHPRPNVTRAIADSLGVRFEYLMELDALRTERVRRARETEEEALELPPFADILGQRIPSFRALPPVVQAGVVHTTLRWMDIDHRRFEASDPSNVDDAAVKAAAAIVATILDPIEAWSIPADRLDSDRWVDYCLAMLNALTLSAPRPDEIPEDLYAKSMAAPRPPSDGPQSDDLKPIQERLRDLLRRRRHGPAR